MEPQRKLPGHPYRRWRVFLYQRDEVGESEGEVDVHRVLLSPHRTQLFVVALFFEQVVEETLLLVPAPANYAKHIT